MLHIISKLTKREEEVLILIAKGYRNKEIADNLKISIYTVQNHIQDLFRKMGVRNRTEAANKYWGIKNNDLKK